MTAPSLNDFARVRDGAVQEIMRNTVGLPADIPTLEKLRVLAFDTGLLAARCDVRARVRREMDQDETRRRLNDIAQAIAERGAAEDWMKHIN